MTYIDAGDVTINNIMKAAEEAGFQKEFAAGVSHASYIRQASTIGEE